jgi:hypothetical protein
LGLRFGVYGHGLDVKPKAEAETALD